MTLIELSALVSQERDAARLICAERGEGDPACRVAWDVVEELLSARADRQPLPNRFDQYCHDFPEAVECRLYDN
ncbi:MAG: Calvin cycle protein CP12 [Synechococcales cyanobacterium]